MAHASPMQRRGLLSRMHRCTSTGQRDGEALNMLEQALDAPLPRASGRRWHRTLDTSLDSPQDILPPEEQTAIGSERYAAPPRSVVVLEAR